MVSPCAFLAAGPVNYDVVYVRWPRRGSSTVVPLPQGEHPFEAEPGAELVLLRRDGSERVLSGGDHVCVQDPMVSFDGEWVYYTKIQDARNASAPSFLHKMRIGGPRADFREIQLTFSDDRVQELSRYFSVRDMGPTPVPGGKIVFTSNRHAMISFRGHPSIRERAGMSLFIMDDHDGSLRTPELANLRQLAHSTLVLALHPYVLKDGRILFTNWDHAGGKYVYAMSTLYTIHPDGSNLAALTEPHDHNKNVDHFATQLTDGTVVTAYYYPSFNFGFGSLMRFPIDPGPGPDYSRGPVNPDLPFENHSRSTRGFDRIGWETVTPHTSPADRPAPNLSGKYCMPAAGPGNSMLVAYSPGGVNHNSQQVGNNPMVLDSGIYLIRDGSNGYVVNPADSSQLVPIRNSPFFNEIWPRPVLPYAAIYGIAAPRRIPPVDPARPADDRMEVGEPHGIVGTSSLYNRESAPRRGDPFRPNKQREIHTGTWMIQGTDAGVVSSDDIHAVRIIGVVPTPLRDPVDSDGLTHLLPDRRSDPIVRGFGSAHGERWKILAEIPVRKYEGGQPVRDPKGDPDTSFAAKIPADTAFFFQGIDKDGMTLFSELTWRSVTSGEVRTDCGGCHAHSIPPVAFGQTAAGRRRPIQARGVNPADPMVARGLWDVTEKTPLVSSDASGPTVRVTDRPMVDVEYRRDVLPILQRRCTGCHRGGGAAGTDLAFDGTGVQDDPYFRLALDDGGKYGGSPPGASYNYPQLSKYVRANQARQSLVVWKLFGRRLDGRTNEERSDDVDFRPHAAPHGATLEESRTIARWIDLGCPIDFAGAAHEGYRYTDDNGSPVVRIATPADGPNQTFDGVVRVGVTDAESGVDWDSLEVWLDRDLENGLQLERVSLANVNRPDCTAVAWVDLERELPSGVEMFLVVSIFDRAGNLGEATVRFSVGETVNPLPREEPEPPPPEEPPAPPADEPPPAPAPDPADSPPPATGGAAAGGGGGGGGGGCTSSSKGDPASLWVLALPLVLGLLRRGLRRRRESALRARGLGTHA